MNDCRYMDFAALHKGGRGLCYGVGMNVRSALIDWSPSSRWRQTARHGLFEVAIVAVGVFLGLAVNNWQSDLQNRQLSKEARTALRAEMLANRVAVFSRMRRNAQLYRDVVAHPDQVGNYVFQYRNRTLILADSAWSLALDSGALRWLTAEERATFTGIYGAQRNVRELVVEELAKWSELAAFAGNDPTADDIRDRARATRVWLSYAQRTQAAQCIVAGRYERALGAKIPFDGLVEFCTRRQFEGDQKGLDQEWARRGWLSPVALPGAEPR